MQGVVDCDKHSFDFDKEINTCVLGGLLDILKKDVKKRKHILETAIELPQLHQLDNSGSSFQKRISFLLPCLKNHLHNIELPDYETKSAVLNHETK